MYNSFLIKRAIVIFITLIYFSVSTGFLLKGHYCMGEFIEAAIDLKGTLQMEMCSEDGGCDSEGCCEQKSTFIKKIQDEQITHAESIYSVPDFAFDIPHLFSYFQPSIEFGFEKETIVQVQKPPPQSIPIFLYVRNLRI
jgi:hypothetical protein